MNIQIVARSEDVTNSEKSYAEEKVGKLTTFYGNIHSIEVILERDGERAMAEVIVAAGRNHTFVAKESQSSIVSAVDLVTDKLERQIKKYKEKLKDHRGKQPPVPKREDTVEETYEDVIQEEY